MTDLAHQIATKAIGGEVYVTSVRDLSDGTVAYVVAYALGHSGGPKWLSRHRFPDVDAATAGAITLADFLGCEVRS